jgi:hypothetical protein
VARLSLRLSHYQLSRLLAGGRLRLRSTLAFFPIYGRVCRDVVTIAFRPRQNGPRRFNAVLLRST